MDIARIPYSPHEFQKEFHRSIANYRVVVAGRQSGKTLAAAHEIANWAMSAPKRWPNDPLPQFWWVTASYRTKGKAYRDIEAILPKGIVARKSEHEAFFTLKNGSTIQFRSADAPDSLVSARVHGLVCDEFTLYDENIWTQLLSKMLLTTGGPVIFIGTPRGYNWGYRVYQNQMHGVDGWQSFHWTSYDSPHVERAELERQKPPVTSDREWRQEVLAQFLADGGSVFRNVDACVGPSGKPDEYTVLGVDIALTHDYCVIWAMNSRFETVETDRFNMIDWPVAKTRIVSMYKRLKAQKCLIDLTGTNLGGSAIETDLRQAGLMVHGINLESGLKRDIINNLIMKFDAVAIRIPNDPVVIEEHKSYTNIRLSSGRDRFTAPDGQYDDTVIANGLACWGLSQFNGRVPNEQEKSELEQILEAEMRSADPNNWGNGGRGEWD